MITIGFDVSKNTLDGVWVTRSGKPKESFKVTNTPYKIREFLSEFRGNHPQIEVVSESTSDYHRKLAMACFELNIPFRLLNPIVTKQYTRATVRKRKTDLTDAVIIARLGLQGEGHICTKDNFSHAKLVSRAADKMSNLERTIGRMLTHLDDREIEDPTTQFVLEECRKSLESARDNLRNHTKNFTDDNIRKLLTSIPGIGKTTADVLMAEIGTVNRFTSAKALVAYAGLDPRINQSGTTLHRNSRLTKRGSQYLRKAVYFSTVVAQLHNNEFKQYHEKKRAEGKSYTEATVANSRSMVNRIYAVWKRGTPYKK